MSFPFDTLHDRTGTHSLKWSGLDRMFGRTDLTAMWVADSDYPAPPAAVERLTERARHGIFGYTLTPEPFFESFINWVDKRHGWKVNRDWLIAAPGIVPAINWAVRTFTDEGDKIIVQPPVYYPFFSAIENNGRELVENNLIEEDGRYSMDFAGLRALIDDRTKLIILCNPHNPVGRVWNNEELKTLGGICLEKGIMIISDEIHSDLVFKGHRHIPIAGLSEELNRVTMTCMAPSKTFNVAGLEASLIVIADETRRRRFRDFQRGIGMGMINIFGIEALTACYEEGEAWLEAQLDYLQGNIDFFNDFIARELPGFHASDLQGTYLLWLDCRSLKMDNARLKEFFVNKVKVGLDDGGMFGRTGEGFMRFNLATPRSNLARVLTNLKTAVTALQKNQE